ncbi:hypothetical protein [Burkholderia phage FLC6]|nr:hypothetical protein [Burkholderia phage FLC6]
MGRGLIGGIADHDVTMTQLHNGTHEDAVLRRFPFHEAMTRPAALTQYRYAVQYMFEIVPEEHWAAVMGRFSRKLVKRYKQLESQANVRK